MHMYDAAMLRKNMLLGKILIIIFIVCSFAYAQPVAHADTDNPRMSWDQKHHIRTQHAEKRPQKTLEEKKAHFKNRLRFRVFSLLDTKLAPIQTKDTNTQIMIYTSILENIDATLLQAQSNNKIRHILILELIREYVISKRAELE